MSFLRYDQWVIPCIFGTFSQILAWMMRGKDEEVESQMIVGAPILSMKLHRNAERERWKNLIICLCYQPEMNCLPVPVSVGWILCQGASSLCLYGETMEGEDNMEDFPSVFLFHGILDEGDQL